MSRNYKFNNPSAAYFVSFATVNWVDVFTRQVYYNVLSESVSYCRKNKGMELFAYCFMPSHVHFIFRSSKEDPAGLLRDYKTHTSKKILKTILDHEQESRKEWMLSIFDMAAKKKGNVKQYQFWQHHNKPIELWSTIVIKQKLDYIHNNPVMSGFVTEPTAWKYSSARNIAGDNTVLAIDDIGFLE